MEKNNKERRYWSKGYGKPFIMMKTGDSINSKMIAKVARICQTKGCWMALNFEEGNEAFVNGVSVDEQRHYAEDAGKTQKEMASIAKTKKKHICLMFETYGVLVKNQH